MSHTQDQPTTWLLDMDGVLIHEEVALPGAEKFLSRLQELDKEFLVLTNNYTIDRKSVV